MLFLITFTIYSAYLFAIVKFIFLPVILLISGFIIAILFKEKKIEIFLFLLPLTGALPSFFNIGYPHNYLSAPIFLFSGILIANLLKNRERLSKGEENWEVFYKYFLWIITISVIFVFLRWSNLFLSLKAFFKDTPVSVNNLRLSFAAIFPLLTILLFSAIPVFYKILKEDRKTRYLYYLSSGYIISVLIALIQKFVNPFFYVARFGNSDWFKYQKNGGFCDQNSFAFFSGILFLMTIYKITKEDEKKLTLFLPFFILGGILSGAKIFFGFLIFGIIIPFLSGTLKTRLKLIILIIISFSIFYLGIGNISGKRAEVAIKSIKKFVSPSTNNNKFSTLNRATNGRAEMIENSIKILKQYPLEGIGAGNFLFFLEFMNYGKKHLHDLTLNEYLRVADETGIIGLLFFLLFIFYYFKSLQTPSKWIMLMVAIILIFNNYLWFPESLVIFCFFLFFLKERPAHSSDNKKTKIIAYSLIFIFVIFNIKDFKSLIPANLVIAKGGTYDYGFWNIEIDNNGKIFKWSKLKAGIYIGKYKKRIIELYCGAPLEKLKNKLQVVNVFWKGKFYKKIIFKKNIFKRIRIPEGEGFFEIEVSQTFNPKALKIGEDTRDLGVKVYYDFKPLENRKTELSIIDKKSLDLFQGERINLRFKLKNYSDEDISSSNLYFISYHLKDMNGKDIKRENRRFQIKDKIKPFETKTINIPLYIDYKKEGKYIINFDIVKEGYFWGSSKGWKMPSLKLKLKNLFSDRFKEKYLRSYFLNKNNKINREQYLLRLILKNNAIKIKGEILGFSPGTDYPQFWIRDMATFIQYAKLFYPIKLFENNLENFLRFQGKKGDIPDWYNLNGKSDKNSVETDQESSFVIAAFEIFKTDHSWIEKKIKRKKILDRMIFALNYVWNYKRNKKFNLIESGFTADWGDVGKIYSDERALKLNKNTPIVFSIYTQSKYIQAIKKLIKILEFSGRNQERILWTERLKLLKNSTKKYLYSPQKGYFIIHFYPTNLNFYNIENNLFALGGNSEAILSDLLNRKEIKRLILISEKKRKKLGLNNISFTLLPPYPDGFFEHPIMKPWNYQNGGAWDWIGARFIKALFKYKFTKKADHYFKTMIKKHLKNLNIYEWEDKNGVGRGADFYTGAAGIIGEILFKYYGGFFENISNYKIKTSPDTSFLKIKVGKDQILIKNLTENRIKTLNKKVQVN